MKSVRRCSFNEADEEDDDDDDANDASFDDEPLDGSGVARSIISFNTAASRFKSCRVEMIEGFLPSLFNRSAATDSIVRLIIEPIFTFCFPNVSCPS